MGKVKEFKSSESTLVNFICKTTEKKRDYLRSRSFKLFGGVIHIFWAHKTHKLKRFIMTGIIAGFVLPLIDGIMFTRSITKLWKVWWYLPLSCKHCLVTLTELFRTFEGAIPHNRRSYSSTIVDIVHSFFSCLFKTISFQIYSYSFLVSLFLEVKELLSISHMCSLNNFVATLKIKK